jgi:hypothetical protein
MGWVDLIRESDQTYIAEGIALLSILAVNVGYLRPGLLKWIAEFCPLLGMLGTVIGFILAFSDVSAEGMMDPEGFKVIVGQMLSGLGTALSTTLVGLVCYIWLEVSHKCTAK